MKAPLFAGVLGMLLASLGHGQDIVGDWHGALEANGAALRLVLHVSKDNSGALTATLDSVDQGANGIPVTSITLENSNLKMNVEAVHGTYEGNVNADATAITGTWSQGQPMPLEFRRGGIAREEPKPGKPSDIDGTWSGVLDMGVAKLRIVFHIVNTTDGLRATVDSPDQGAAGIPVTAVTRNGSSLKMDMKSLGATYEGTISADLHKISGTFTQNGSNTPLELARAKGAEMNRA